MVKEYLLQNQKYIVPTYVVHCSTLQLQCTTQSTQRMQFVATLQLHCLHCTTYYVVCTYIVATMLLCRKIVLCTLFFLIQKNENKSKSEYIIYNYNINDSQQFLSNFSNSIHINKIERTWQTVNSYIRRGRKSILTICCKVLLNEIYINQEIFEEILKIMANTKFS